MVARLTLAAVALLAAATAHAETAAAPDALETLRATLRGFSGTTPVTATIERAVTSERKDRPLEAGRVTLQVAAGRNGITVGFPPDVLEQLRAERANPDPEKSEPAKRTLENFDATDIAEILNAATGLLTELDGAALKSVTEAERDGKPARLLEVELKLRVNKANSKWVKSASRSMKLWTTPEGLPLAEETQGAYTVGLLIFTFDAVEWRTQTFAPKGDRLLAVRRAARFDGEGLGESQHSTSETVLRLQGS